MAVNISGDTGIDKITDGSVVADDLASTLDLSGKTITLATDAAVVSKLSTASGSAPSYSARAWVNFNGSGTVAIRSSGNVSSITDNGTGNYTVNFTTAMADTNYTIVSDANYMNSANDSILLSGPRNDSTYGNTFATGSVKVQSSDQNQNAYDAVLVSVAVFR